jgi:hypothetical protein
VLKLPDGRRMTVAQFKAVRAQTQSTPVHAASTATGQRVVKVSRGTSLAELLKRPDTDVLESPSGKRITVGELRRFSQSLPQNLRNR